MTQVNDKLLKQLHKTELKTAIKFLLCCYSFLHLQYLQPPQIIFKRCLFDSDVPLDIILVLNTKITKTRRTIKRIFISGKVFTCYNTLQMVIRCYNKLESN